MNITRLIRLLINKLHEIQTQGYESQKVKHSTLHHHVNNKTFCALLYALFVDKIDNNNIKHVDDYAQCPHTSKYLNLS